MIEMKVLTFGLFIIGVLLIVFWFNVKCNDKPSKCAKYVMMMCGGIDILYSIIWYLHI